MGVWRLGSHLALAVRDLQRSIEFYRGVFGSTVVYRGAACAQLQTPGARDVLVLEKHRAGAGKGGGVEHFGYRLRSPRGIAGAARAVNAAGGTVISQGDFVPGEPYLFARDPDGYTVEIWFELPTPVDPQRKRRT